MPPVRAWFIAALTSVLPQLVLSSEVARTPPPVYAERIAALLTPLAAVLPGRTAFPDDKTGGIVLLSERIDYRDDDGSAYRAYHVIYHAIDQSAIETFGTDVFSYDRMREDLFLIDAATIAPDGRRQTVEDKGAFIQTPQYEAQNSLYTSEAELRVIYPNVGPGATTEAIVLVRENTPVMPGEYATSVTFGRSWPLYRLRRVVDFPADFFARVHVFGSNAGVPEATRDSYAPGRERRTWERSSVPPVPWEENGPQWEYRGPTLWLTTLDSWDELAAWYYGLIADRSDLGPELAAQVEAWTSSLPDRRAIIDKLTEVVANDVRYAALEFGLAGYQPHPCREVWDKRYGDCKDKANLLRAMLAHKGIVAHLVLVETRGMGRIERASPSWQHFNHAILAVENETGSGYLFCDPTIEHLPAGSIGLRDRAREVLLVKHGRAEWAQTPDTLDSALRINADLVLGADGGISGWLALATEGTDAALYTDFYNGKDPDERRRSLQQYLDGFFPGSEVIDVDYTPPPGAVREAKIRAYFVRAARGSAEQSLVFPYPKHWLPDVDTKGDRRFPYETTRHEESVTVTLALPANWNARTLPSAFAAPSEVAQFDAAWTVRDDKLEARLAWHPKRAVLAPAEYAVFQRSVRAFASWLEQPAVLAPAGAGSVAATNGAPAGGDPLRDFPILPTGAGQLRLVDEKYPSAQHDAVRMAALQRVLQWFPNDNETVFEAQAKIAVLDWDHDRVTDAEFADRIAALLARHGTQISAGVRTWGEYLEAKARWNATKDPAAITRLCQLADDTSLSEYRRGWSAEAAGQFLSDSDPAAAVAFLRRHDDYESEARDAIVRLITRILARTDDAASLQEWTVDIARDHPDAADALFAVVITQLSDQSGELPAKTRLEFLTTLEGVVSSASTYPRAHPQLAQLRAAATNTRAVDAFRQEITAWLNAHPPAWWTREKDPAYADVAALVTRIKDRNEAHDPEGLVNAWLQLALHHEADFAIFAEYTRWSLWWLHNRRIADDLLDAIGRATLQLPPEADEEVIESWNLYATWLGEVARLDEARTLFARSYDAPAAKPHQQVDAAGELGLLEFKAGNADAALASLSRIEPLHLAHKWSSSFLYVAILLHLERHDYDHALALLQLIRAEKPENVEGSKHSTALRHLLRAAETPAAIKGYWEHRKAWRPTWDMLLGAQRYTRSSKLPLTLDSDATTIMQRIDKARGSKDLPGFLRELDALALTAQWVPMYASDFVRQSGHADEFSKLLQRALYELGLLLVGGLEPVDPQFDHTGRFWEIALLSDLGRTTAAAAAARRLANDAGLAARLGQSGLRLWVANSRNQPDADEAVLALAEALAGPTAFYDRLECVETLLTAYTASGDVAAQRALLEREVNRKGFDAKSDSGGRLQARYAQFRNDGASGARLTTAINAWRKKHHLEWLDHVPPQTLDEPRYAQLKTPVYQTPDGFTTAEAIKANLLAALDERQKTDTRGEAFYAAAWSVAFAAEDLREFAAVFRDVAGMDAVPANPRANSVAVATNTLLRNREDELAAALATDAVASIVRDDIRADFTRAQRALQRIASGGNHWETDAITLLAAKPLERFSVTVIDRIVRQLAFAGEYDRARAVITAAKDFAVDPGMQQSIPALRLEWTRVVQSLREQTGLVALVRGALERLPAQYRTPSDNVLHRFAFKDTSNLTDEERIALAYHTVTTGRGLPEFWGSALYDLVGARIFAKEHRMLFPDLLEQGLRSDAPDVALAPFVAALANGGDIDHADIRKRVTALLEEFRTSARATSYPQTVQAITNVRAYHTLRTSRETKPPALFDYAQTATLAPGMRTSLQLRFHQSRGQHSDALQLIGKMSADELTRAQNFTPARLELLQAGRTAEVELLDESMHTILERQMPEFWREPEQVGLGDWFEVVDVLRVSDILTDEWYDHAASVAPSPMRRTSLRLAQAWLKRDWPAIRDAADAALAVLADSFDSYYLRAVARHELRDNRGARDDLRVFLKYCLNSEHYPAALALFHKIAPGEKVGGAP